MGARSRGVRAIPVATLACPAIDVAMYGKGAGTAWDGRLAGCPRGPALCVDLQMRDGVFTQPRCKSASGCRCPLQTDLGHSVTKFKRLRLPIPVVERLTS